MATKLFTLDSDRRASRVLGGGAAAWCLACGMCLASCGSVFGQDNAGAAADAGAVNPQPAQSDALPTEQAQMAERLLRLEELLLRSADLEALENPARAALLQRAVQLSKQGQLGDLLAKAAGALEQRQYSEAIEQQQLGLDNLKRLLELLQSENREKRVREEKEQVRRWIEEADRLLRMQSSLRGRTEGGQDAQDAASDQQRLAAKAQEIADDISGGESPSDGEQSDEQTDGDKQEAKQGSQPGESLEDESDANKQDGAQEPTSGEGEEAAGEKSDGASADAQQSGSDEQSQSGADGKQPGADEKQSGEKEASKEQSGDEDSAEKDDPGKASESQPGSDSPQAGDGESAEGKEKSAGESGQPQSGQKSSPAQPSQPAEGQPSDSQGQPSDGSGGQQSPPPPASPEQRARQRIQQAQQRMQEAQERLEEAERDEAVDKQRQAEQELREAIEELEEILRQLREEEIERSLASLEDRLKRMLNMQTKVLEETTRLQEIAGGEPNRQVEIRANGLAQEQQKIVREGELALLLLREEGSSNAFPEALEQVNRDVVNVAQRLSEADVGELTTIIEQEIVTSLEEMLAALKQLQKENKERRDQQQPPMQGQPGQPGEQPLVNQLAEIRLVRTLQMRINKRTEAFSKMLQDPADPVGQIEQAEILGELRELAGRQKSLQEVTRNIEAGVENR